MILGDSILHTASIARFTSVVTRTNHAREFLRGKFWLFLRLDRNVPEAGNELLIVFHHLGEELFVREEACLRALVGVDEDHEARETEGMIRMNRRENRSPIRSS